MHVEGDGVLADMYRSLITAFDPVEDVNPNIDTTMCLPNPHEPNLDTYRTIGKWPHCTSLIIQQYSENENANSQKDVDMQTNRNTFIDFTERHKAFKDDEYV